MLLLDYYTPITTPPSCLLIMLVCLSSYYSLYLISLLYCTITKYTPIILFIIITMSTIITSPSWLNPPFLLLLHQGRARLRRGWRRGQVPPLYCHRTAIILLLYYLQLYLPPALLPHPAIIIIIFSTMQIYSLPCNYRFDSYPFFISLSSFDVYYRTYLSSLPLYYPYYRLFFFLLGYMFRLCKRQY